MTDDKSESGNADDSFSISRNEMIPIGTNGIGKRSWSNRVVVVCTSQDGPLCGFADPLYGFADPLYCFTEPCIGFTYLKSHFAQSRKGFRRQLSASRLPMYCQKSSLQLPYSLWKGAHEDLIMIQRWFGWLSLRSCILSPIMACDPLCSGEPGMMV